MHTPINHWIYSSILLCISLLYSCKPLSQQELSGLWQLDEAKVDAMERPFDPIFIQLNTNNSFSVSKQSGDLTGLYYLGGNNKIRLESKDNRWFNTMWSVTYFDDVMFFDGVEFGYRGTKLRFKRIDKIPDYQEFEDLVIGDWSLYKIRSNDKIEKPSHTNFTIRKDGTYTIHDDHGIVESGKAIINTRHRKIIFENDHTIWKAWFYGRELRLNNVALGLEYSLRQSIDG